MSHTQHSNKDEDGSDAEMFIVTILVVVGVCLFLVHPILMALYAVIVLFPLALSHFD